MKYVVTTERLLGVRCHRCKVPFRRLGDLAGVILTVDGRLYFHVKCIVRRARLTDEIAIYPASIRAHARARRSRVQA